MTNHTKSTRYIGKNDYAAVVNGIEIGFSDTAFGAEIIANDYVSAQIELAARAADGAEGATAMNTYTIQTTGENLANNYSGFGEWEYRGRSNRVTTETYTVTIPAGRTAAFEQLLDTDDSVLSYTEIATPNPSAAARAADGAEGATAMNTYTIAAAIKSTLANRMAEVSHVAYCPAAQGEWYAVDTDGDGVLDDVAHAQVNRQFNPWHDAAVAIPIEECFDHDGNDFGWGEGINDQFEYAASWALDCMLDTVAADEA